jgi:hypothetical protein
MSSITFSTLDSLPGPDLLDLLRRYAKANKKADPVGKALSWHQDQLAISLGFKNWSMLHKHLASANWSAVDQLKTLALKKPDLGEFVEEHAYKTIDEDAREVQSPGRFRLLRQRVGNRLQLARRRDGHGAGRGVLGQVPSRADREGRLGP